ncbi:MAG: PAS domain S-box protein [Pseudomonadota bacterium]
MKLNLRTKLIGSFVIILLLMIVVGLMGTHTSKTIRDRLDNIIEKDVKSANILGDVARRAGFIRANSLLHLLTKSIDDMKRYESEVTDWVGKINTDLNTLKNIFKDQATLDKLAEFRTVWETYLRVWREQVVPLSRANRDEEVFTLARKSGAGGMAAREAMYKLGELHDVNVAAANHRLKLADQDSRKSQYILSAVILLAIILGLAFGIRQGSLIAGSANTVSKAAQLVAAGDLDQRVMVKTGDEIESMANSFNTMTVKLKTMLEELQREIIERRRAEDRQRESKQWLSTTLRSIGDAVIATDAEGLVTLMNPVAEDLTGWDEAETAGKPLEDVFNIINDQTGGRAENPVSKVLREGVVVGLADHTVLIAKDGTKRPIADSGAPIRDEEGEIIGTVIVFRDITELKQAEEELRKHRDHLEELVKERTEALRESEEKYRNLTESLDELIYRADPETLVATYVNRAVERVYGYTVEEWLGDPTLWESTIHPEDKERVVAEMTEAQRKMESGAIEYRIIRKDKAVRWVEDHASWEKDQQGNIVSLNGVIYEITERMRAEERIRRLSTAVEQSIDGIEIADMEEKLTYVNDAFARMHGYSHEEMIGMKIEDLHNEAQMDELKSTLQQIKTTGSWLGEITHIRKGGTPFPTYMSTTLLLDAEGRPIGILAVVKDISEQKKLETQFRQAQKMEAIGTLAGGVAHDFNNLLTSILGNAELALMDLGKDNPLCESLKEIIKAGNSAASLTRQLLAFSRKQILRPVVLNLNTVTADIDKMLRRMIGEDIELKTLLEPDLGNVTSDPGQIEQVLINLAVNARDAMPRGGKLTVETTNVDLEEDYFVNHGVGAVPGPYVMLAVSDTGCGMDKETKSRIFEPFFTTKEKGKGTGLGLSTVYGIVKQSNGYVWVYSEPGRGTTFKIYLSRMEGEAVLLKKEKGSLEKLKGSEAVLIVEDDAALRNLAQKTLHLYGYSVLEAENGEEALRVSKEHEGPIHLMITDVVMPKMGGKEVAERLQPLYPQMKVVYMSGYTDNAIAHHGVLEPGLNYLEKPFTPEGLARKVREVLDG